MSLETRILIVDDDPVNRELFRWALCEHCQIDELTNGNGAADQIVRGAYDLVLLDIMMPLVDGVEVVEELGQSRPDLLQQVVVVTAALNTEFASRIRAWPVGALVERPYDPEDILALYNKHIGPERQPA
ncbi:response regulator [Maricaulis parjimensis]|uniref:response regulator n=1 Tax=Maricaulis parjimensis TaxID=144023 RepID=UPI00193AB365|nr:response regulator [Maricaulis parjimensis]